MVAIDTGIFFTGRRPAFNSRLLIPGAALATLLLVAASGIWHGMTADPASLGNGFRAGSAIATRFASLIFFLAIIAGPLGRLLPLKALRSFAAMRRDLLRAFAASYGIYILSIVGPNLPGMGLTPGMAAFALFSTTVLAVMMLASSGWLAAHLGKAGSHTMLGIAASYFWLSFTLTGIAHISGPHRPDGYYGFCLSLMVAALLLRFADSFRTHLKADVRITAP